MYHSEHVDVRRQLCEADSLQPSLHGFWGSNSAYQACVAITILAHWVISSAHLEEVFSEPGSHLVPANLLVHNNEYYLHVHSSVFMFICSTRKMSSIHASISKYSSALVFTHLYRFLHFLYTFSIFIYKSIFLDIFSPRKLDIQLHTSVFVILHALSSKQVSTLCMRNHPPAQSSSPTLPPCHPSTHIYT